MSKENEIIRFEERFTEEVIEIAAVTGASGIGAGRARGDVLWQASIKLAAWRPLRSEEAVNYEEYRLVWLADDEQWQVSKNILQGDSVVRLRVRKGDKSMMLLEVLDSSYQDRELEAILEETLKPVFYHDEVLGDFELNRQVKWFEKTITWAGEEGRLNFDYDKEAIMKSAINTAHILFKDQEQWSHKIRVFAAEELVSLANDWAEEDEEITKETFIELIALTDISVRPDGGFEIFFSDGDMFAGHCIIVTGNIDGTMESAEMAG